MKNKSLIVLVILLILFSYSCKKKEDKIVGIWQYVYLKSSDSNKVQTWEFKNDKTFIRSEKITDTVMVDTANFSISPRFFDSPNLLISNLPLTIEGLDFNGTYEVLTLNRKYLIIQRILLDNGNSGSAFLRAEFVKK